MISELNLGADWEQSKRLVAHLHNMWAKLKTDYDQIVKERDEAYAEIRERDLNDISESGDSEVFED